MPPQRSSPACGDGGGDAPIYLLRRPLQPASALAPPPQTQIRNLPSTSPTRLLILPRAPNSASTQEEDLPRSLAKGTTFLWWHGDACQGVGLPRHMASSSPAMDPSAVCSGYERTRGHRSAPTSDPRTGNKARSFADVVRQGCCIQRSDQLTSSPQGSSSHPTPATRRCTKVQFAVFPTVATFAVLSPPAAVGRPGLAKQPNGLAKISRPRPILKRQHNGSSTAIDTISQDGFVPPSCPSNQLGWHENLVTEQQPWQLVRRKRWWRRERRVSINSVASAVMPKGQQKFKAKVKGRCFNCLRLDHRVAQCRDPTRCWRCLGNGHISSFCVSKASSGRICPCASKLPSPLLCCQTPQAASVLPTKPHPPPSEHNTHCSAASSQTRAQLGMERRHSFGGAPAGIRHPPSQQVRQEGCLDLSVLEPMGSAVNYPGNPRFCPRFAFKIAASSEEMDSRRELLTNNAVLIT